MEQPKKIPSLKYNGEIHLAIGSSKTEKKWKNREMSWSDFLERLRTPTVTQETLQDYKKMPRSKQDAIKDVGGFVGGWLKEGKRKRGHVQQRSLVALDADSTTLDFWDDVQLLFDHAVAIYTTHSHLAKGPRYRLIFPLKRPVTADEYEPLARKLAEIFGMDNFDDTTYQAERLQYWPSHSYDAEYFTDYLDLPWLDPDTILKQYEDWRDSSFWPESSRGHSIRENQAKKAGDPLTKKGIVGAFCRTYDIVSAIQTFLPDVYGPTGHDDRWTYLEGSTSGGLVIYDDKFAYSHHGTDPVGDHLVNAFDLVRIHKFGDLDEEVKPKTNITKYPSYMEMAELVSEDAAVKKEVVRQSMAEAQSDFEDLEGDESLNWMDGIDWDIEPKTGDLLATAKNVKAIVEQDPLLKNKFGNDNFNIRISLKEDLPWREKREDLSWSDTDMAALRVYVETKFGIRQKSLIDDAFLLASWKNQFHPVRDYLDPLKWDGVKRLETILVDCLGSEDTTYTRTVTRKWFTAAVARIYVPGIKFDHLLVLSGGQGLGKSFLGDRMAGEWFSDSLTTVNGKEAFESLLGAWIVEVGEMAATKKAEVEQAKQFFSKRSDRYRAAYGRFPKEVKRQNVFFGTDNNGIFLHDATGNRRYWPVDVDVVKPKFRPSDIDDYLRDQLWAEAKQYWEQGEKLYLSPEEELLAKEQQEAHRDISEYEGQLEEYLRIPITEDWYERTPAERRIFVQDWLSGDDMEETGTIKREKVCVSEVCQEMLGTGLSNVHPGKKAEIRGALNNMKEWEKKRGGDKGRLKFGKGYGPQVAWVRKS